MVQLFGFSIPENARRMFKPLVRNNLLEIEKSLVPQMKAVLANYMEDVVDETVAKGRFKSRSGALVKSLYSGIKVRGSRLDNISGSYNSLWYGRLLQTGGVVTPNTAEVLTLPLPAALRPDGTPKLKSPRSWKRFGTFSYTSKKTGQGYLAYRGADGKLVLLYVYIDAVKIKKRLFLREIHTQHLNILVKRWGDLMVEAMLKTDLYGFVKSPRKRQTIVFDVVKTVSGKFKPQIGN